MRKPITKPLVLAIAFLASGCAAGAIDGDAAYSNDPVSSDEEPAAPPGGGASTVGAGARTPLETLAVPSADGCSACRPGPIPWQDLTTPRDRD